VRSLEVDPDQPRALENLANLLADLGRPDEAIPHYQRALELTRATGEDLRTFYWNLGLVYREKGSLPEALAQFEQGLALYPDDPRLHYVYGETLLLAGRRAEAVAAFREALRWSDEDPQFRQAAAQALKQLVPGG
jgi:tetratricopeptide (TPR) repeat protein